MLKKGKNREKIFSSFKKKKGRKKRGPKMRSRREGSCGLKWMATGITKKQRH